MPADTETFNCNVGAQDEMMRRIRITALAITVLLACWYGAASFRLLRAHSDFQRARQTQPDTLGYPNSGMSTFFASSSLRFGHSVGPLLKNPFRNDIRLYFDHKPKFNRLSEDAWASNETGVWQLKIHN